MLHLNGKIALITGASSGIGAATSVLFAKLGAQLSLTGRNVENLDRVASECAAVSPHGKPFIVSGDLTKEADVENVVKRTLDKFGRLDVLVNNAGILLTGSIENTTLQQYDHIMDANVRSIYHLTMLCVPHLTSSKGNIVNVSSVNGLRSFAGVLAYNISKSAVDQFTRCVALELASKPVRVNSVNPGVVLTEIHKRGGMTEENYNAFLERAKTTQALGRPGQAEEVANAIAFLASDLASFITGANLPVDGGRMCNQQTALVCAYDDHLASPQWVGLPYEETFALFEQYPVGSADVAHFQRIKCKRDQKQEKPVEA